MFLIGCFIWVSLGMCSLQKERHQNVHTLYKLVFQIHLENKYLVLIINNRGQKTGIIANEQISIQIKNG